jgi:hypothetical protein
MVYEAAQEYSTMLKRRKNIKKKELKEFEVAYVGASLPRQ